MILCEYLKCFCFTFQTKDSKKISDLFLCLLRLPCISAGELIYSKTGIFHGDAVSRFLRRNIPAVFDCNWMLEVFMKMIYIFKYTIFKTGRNADVIKN